MSNGKVCETTSRFRGVVGYHTCFTRRRSPVRSRTEPFFLGTQILIFAVAERFELNDFKRYLIGFGYLRQIVVKAVEGDLSPGFRFS